MSSAYREYEMWYCPANFASCRSRFLQTMFVKTGEQGDPCGNTTAVLSSTSTSVQQSPPIASAIVSLNEKGTHFNDAHTRDFEILGTKSSRSALKTQLFP